jgi:hypothetical protein
MKLNITIELDDSQIEQFATENSLDKADVVHGINNTAYLGIDCIMGMLSRQYDGLDGDGWVNADPPGNPNYLVIPTNYEINGLFQSVNDIFAQYDSGDISQAQANEILVRCCYAFLNNSKNHPLKA